MHVVQLCDEAVGDYYSGGGSHELISPATTNRTASLKLRQVATRLPAMSSSELAVSALTTSVLVVPGLDTC